MRQVLIALDGPSLHCVQCRESEPDSIHAEYFHAKPIQRYSGGGQRPLSLRPQCSNEAESRKRAAGHGLLANSCIGQLIQRFDYPLI